MTDDASSPDFWLREARGPFDELLAVAAAEGVGRARERLEVLRQAYLGLREVGEERPLAELDGHGRLDRQIARTRGVWALWMLRGALGSLDFRELQHAWADGRAQTTAGLRGWLEGTFIDFWICRTGLPAYELRAATARRVGQGFQVAARVTNAGDGGVMAPVVIQTEEGARHTVAVSVATGETLEVTYSVLTRPVQAAVDPDGELLQGERDRSWRPVHLRRWRIF